MTQHDLTALMLTWNSAAYLDRALESLVADLADAGLSAQVYLIDNGSTDGTASMVLSWADRHPGLIRPLLLSRNLGTTVPRNMALRSTNSPYALVLDSDTEILPGALRALVDHLEAHPQVGLAAPTLMLPDGSLQESARRFPTALTKMLRLSPLRATRGLLARDELYLKDGQGPHDVDYAISACWLLRRSALDRVGLLDERIFYAPEDVDLCLRLWKGGYRIQLVPGARVVHHTQRITRRSPVSLMALSHLWGLIYLWRKHGYLVSRSALYGQMARKEG